jgi:nucleoside-diphosphate kinase
MDNNIQKTLVIIKPDGVQRGIIGEIISRFEQRGFKLVAAKFVSVSKDLAEKHYAVHKGKSFYDGLLRYIISTPVLAMVWEGEYAISAVRQTVGSTNPLEAAPGTIRHDFALLTSRNLIHASDSKETAEKEISLWFSKAEIFGWKQSNDAWIYGKN